MTASTAAPKDPRICCVVRVSTLEFVREAMSEPTFHARLDPIDPTRNTATANIHTRFPPNRSWAHVLSTMESVAARARTGVAVLYRRWPRKDDLVIAALQRGDLLLTLRPVPEKRALEIVDDLFLSLVRAWQVT